MADGAVNSWIFQAKQKVRQKKANTDSVEILGKQQKPIALIVTAADFAIDPHYLTGANPGTFYVLRNAGGLVPPGGGDSMDIATGASLEFAVQIHAVQHIVVMTSPHCGLLNYLLNEDADGIGTVVGGQFLPNWTKLVGSAMNRVTDKNISREDRIRIFSQELIRISFENLMTYPWILDRVFNGSISLHGWYCDEVEGVFACFDPSTDEFNIN